MHFGIGRSCRDVSLVGVAWHAHHDEHNSHNSVHGHRHSVDWGGHVDPTFSRSCSWDWCKARAQKLNLYTRARIQLLRRLPCWNKYNSTCSSRSATRHSCRVEMWRGEPNGIIWAKVKLHIRQFIVVFDLAGDTAIESRTSSWNRSHTRWKQCQIFPCCRRRAERCASCAACFRFLDWDYLFRCSYISGLFN